MRIQSQQYCPVLTQNFDVPKANEVPHEHLDISECEHLSPDLIEFAEM